MQPQRGYYMDVHREQTHWTDSHFDIYWIHFIPLNPELTAALQYVPAFFEWPERWCKTRNTDIKTLSITSDKRTLAQEMRIHGLLLTMLGALLQEHTPTTMSDFPEDVYKALLFMDLHSNKHLSLEQIAEHVNLSPNYFHRRFCETMELTPHKYMETRRMNSARHLLLTTNLSIQKIAEELGFKSPFYFSRTFRKCFGVSPRHMRSSHQP